MKLVCEKNKCTGCMACISKCSKNAITIRDDLYAYNAVIDETICIHCGACERICPNIHPLMKTQPKEWFEGWAEEIQTRERASSGGIASVLIQKFMENGGYVAACLFQDGEFPFYLTQDEKESKWFAGSKYVKSNPRGIYKKIEEKLNEGKKVLFIGLPCQVAAVKKTIKNDDCLYTIDLICHGSPSPRILKIFLEEMGINIKSIKEISFRKKTSFKIQIDHKDLLPFGMEDMYMHAFLKSLDYTESCYYCPYAEIGRISDLTVGDSWGSELNEAEQKKGISLILCQTEKGKELLDSARVILKEVDLDKAVKANSQLSHPSIMPKERKKFFLYLRDGFHKAMAKAEPKYYFKQKLKQFLKKI